MDCIEGTGTFTPETTQKGEFCFIQFIESGCIPTKFSKKWNRHY